ncbi:MAG: hypothetical protein V1495_07070 [Pseudomonadota bacterium]
MNARTIVLAGSVLSASAFAQQGAPNVPPQGFQFIPSLAITETYDDNALGTQSGESVDSAMILEPSVQFLNTSDRSNQELDYTLSYEKFWGGTLRRSFSHQGRYRGLFDVSPRVTLTVEQRISYSPLISLLYSPDLNTTPQFVRLKTFRNATEFSPMVRLSERSNLELKGAFYLTLSREAQMFATTPVNTRPIYQAKGGMTLVHRLNERDSIRPSLTTDYFWFPGSNDVVNLSANVGWSRRWNPSLETVLGGGILETVPRGGGDSLTNLAGKVSASYREDPWEFHMTYARSSSTLAGFSATFIQDTVTAGTSVLFAQTWVFRLDPAYSRSVSAETGAVLAGLFVDTGIQGMIRPGLQLSIHYRYRVQGSDNPAWEGYTRNLAAATLNIVNFRDLKI